ncbi:PREDICTED: uncharacterized protein LOC108765496 [Trachymyrmex cornetzi]|uniref:uncharacterized protein LOC108765496 n=1 Tax=Trachymyrmex cornetzi TaxID=471704 RepID=UPI00084F0782|nr:PREDICTED: uncharacterized protein LOC108765496 [Trachymyrmex cornetzi]
MFLVDHIQPRQTTSNYRHSKPIHNKASNLLNSLASQRLISTPPCTSSQSNSDNSSDVLNMFEFFTESSSKDEEMFSKVNSKDSSSTLASSNLSILSDNVLQVY